MRLEVRLDVDPAVHPGQLLVRRAANNEDSSVVAPDKMMTSSNLAE
jgi:hypothetical protein